MIIGLSDTQILSHKHFTKTYKIAGKNLTFESGKLALLADGSVVISDEEGNYLLTTAGINEKIKSGTDFFPMTCEYQEKYYAAGKIGGNRFMKRESRPSEVATLNSRMIDRPIRPMFPKGTVNEVQIISTILSSSGLSDYGFYGITGASLALMLSGSTEFTGPVSGCRIIMDSENNFKFDPTFEELLTAQLDLTIAGTLDSITMVESQGKEVSGDIILKAFEFAHAIIKEICNAQLDFVSNYSKVHPLPAKSKLVVKSLSKELYSKIEGYVTEDKMTPLYYVSKTEFHEEMHNLSEEVKLWLGYSEDTEEMTIGEIEECVYKAIKKHMRKNVLSNKTRLDGRKTDQVRPVRGEFGILPRVHGSALFQRGITQALTIATLGGPGDMQLVDDMFEQTSKRYIHHYNFPPFSVGETKPLRGPTRRDIGHGRLAEKALEPVLPSLEEFPYFIRCVSEITTCNGSSSMASVCGSSMSLMDAGVPIKNIVSGVAMGMIYDEESGKYEILSDIQAQEDFLGDMDFKVAGTSAGFTALQMDCKIKGLSMEVVGKVLTQSKEALEYIKTEMIRDLSESRKELSPYAPFIVSSRIAVDKIREVIGKGGETIQKISKEYEVKIDISEDGLLSVTAKNQVQGKGAIEFITKMLKGMEVGDAGEGKVAKILDGIGAIIDLGSGKSGMIHISKIAKERVTNIGDYLKEGDIVEYKVITVDKEKGKVGLERIIKE
ncbi:MAG: polyribonucleotide nucleotidyltransferase [Candidatus Gracilibacteria bacterium]|nr:polyribonucleotide nucleotidyltransferase [Candidatus Gracilibacteria bacterium]MDD2909095.1 polyribonucleotide nucleotidyltransferase [Candidatus Gracilibacteria bacterium]